MSELDIKPPLSDVQKEAKLIEDLTPRAIHGDGEAISRLMHEAHMILSSPNRNFVDALNKQFVVDAEAADAHDHSTPPWMEKLFDRTTSPATIDKHGTLTIREKWDRLTFYPDGSVDTMDDRALEPKALAGLVDRDRSAPPDFLQPHKQSAKVVDLASSLESLAKRSLNGDAAAAKQIAEMVQHIKDDPVLVNSLHEQLAYDRTHDPALPPMEFFVDEVYQSGLTTFPRLTITNPDAPDDRQNFLFDGTVGTSYDDKLRPSISNFQIRLDALPQK